MLYVYLEKMCAPGRIRTRNPPDLSVRLTNGGRCHQFCTVSRPSPHPTNGLLTVRSRFGNGQRSLEGHISNFKKCKNSNDNKYNTLLPRIMIVRSSFLPGGH